MEFQQLEMFAAIVEEGTILRASERVFRTGPAVSIALKKLEEEVGSPLFTKPDRNNFQLTDAGSLLYSYASRILNLRSDALSGLRDLAKCKNGLVRIGANESTSLYLLPKLVHAFQEQHPGLKIEATCDNSESIMTRLKDCHLDLALVALSSDEPSLTKHLITRDEIVLITNPEHRLASLSEVRIKDLNEEVLIAEGGRSSLHEEVAQAFRECGTEFDPVVSNVTIEAIKRMVTEGVGIGFVPSISVHDEEDRKELTTIKVHGVSRQRELRLIHRKDESLSPAAQAFLKVSLRLAREWASESKSQTESVSRNTEGVKSNGRLTRARSYC
ncbi:MAG TPA: LysR family transcriptional regulator [Pyrinomonadaceae bacterium]|jgi:DNA-binding transcriptional LysR family regulator